MSRTKHLWLFSAQLSLLAAIAFLLRFASVTDFLYSGFVKDPVRNAPAGNCIVAPADGIVLYVKKIQNGVIPEIVKKGVSVPLVEHLKTDLPRTIESGWLVGIYMNTYGVHINRIPNHGKILKQYIFNGPHMSMTDAEVKIILTQMVPGLTSLRKALGLAPYAIAKESDYILKSARETLVMEDARGKLLCTVRIADYFVGKILTWVKMGQPLERGQKFGMITWGSQTDLLMEGDDLTLKIKEGDYVYGGETVLASY